MPCELLIVMQPTETLPGCNSNPLRLRRIQVSHNLTGGIGSKSKKWGREFVLFIL